MAEFSGSLVLKFMSMVKCVQAYVCVCVCFGVNKRRRVWVDNVHVWRMREQFEWTNSLEAVQS